MAKNNYNYHIWLGSYEDAKRYFDQKGEINGNPRQLRLEPELNSLIEPVTIIFNGQLRDRFFLEEIDLITSKYKDEKSLREALFKLGALSTGKDEITITHLYNGLRKKFVIYESAIIQHYSKEVLAAVATGIPKDKVYLSNSRKLDEFCEKILQLSKERSFAATAQIYRVRPDLITLILDYNNKRLSTRDTAILKGKIHSYFKNYRTLRALVLTEKEMTKKNKVVDHSVKRINEKMMLMSEVRNNPIENQRLAELFETGGLDAVISGMSLNELYTCSLNDLRRIGLLSSDVFLEEEYASISQNKKNSKESSSTYTAEDKRKIIELYKLLLAEEKYKQEAIESPELAKIYEELCYDGKKISLEELFDLFSIDDIFTEENFEDLKRLGLIPADCSKLSFGIKKQTPSQPTNSDEEYINLSSFMLEDGVLDMDEFYSCYDLEHIKHPTDSSPADSLKDPNQDGILVNGKKVSK